MAEGFEVKVPITIKGGKEGEKVGKQIGEKIASQLQKAFRAVNIGGKTGGGTGIGGSVGLMGVSKGLRGVATKLGIVGAAIGAAVGLLAKSSPYLKGILSIFSRAFMIFFRPFGDFLATLLRPLAVLLMKMAVAFLKWTRPISGQVRENVAAAPQIGSTGNLAADIPIRIANWAIKIGVALGTVAMEIAKAAFDLGTKIGQWLFDEVIEPAGHFLSAKLLTVWKWTKDFAGWLWDQITSIWSWPFDLSLWIWNKIMSIWNYTMDFGGWIWEQIMTIWNYTQDFGSWLWSRITNAFSNVGGWLSGIGAYLYETITKSISQAFSGFKFGWSWFWQKGEGQVGIPNVPSDGMYKLHKGEEVVPRTRVGQNKSIVLNPTFQFSGNVSRDIDIDLIARRASRVTEMELKRRGIL